MLHDRKKALSQNFIQETQRQKIFIVYLSKFNFEVGIPLFLLHFYSCKTKDQYSFNPVTDQQACQPILLTSVVVHEQEGVAKDDVIVIRHDSIQLDPPLVASCLERE